MALHTPDPDDPGAPVHRAAEGPPPSPNDVRRTLEGVIDPELRASIVELGMVRDVRVADDGQVTVKVALTTAGCPLRAQIQSDVESKVRGLRGVTDVRVEYGEMTQDEKSAVMQRARWQARENAPGTEVLPTTRVLAVASGKGTLPPRSRRRAGPSGCSTPTSGASAFRGCSASKAGSVALRARSTRTRSRSRTWPTRPARRVGSRSSRWGSSSMTPRRR